jgi:outer membrane biogenesis lipoprotein LolB
MEKFNFMKVVLFVMVMLILISCSSKKSNNSTSEKQVYKWENKVVSKRKFDKLLYQFTHDYVKNSTKEEQELLKDLIVVYDTLPKKKKD